ncbi:MAG TPA: hypothetical protein VFH78_16435 [Candidatus Thermoplasmatota archaeon]|nr:hypothetical protein [Candidatus Thermoplasmatota archaeon]
MRILSFLLLAAAAAFLAGCMGGGDSSEGGNGDGGTTNASTNTTTSIPMNFQASGPGPLSPDGGSFEVPANATQVLIEARWECTSPTCDVTITVLDANGTEVASGSGSGQADLSLDAPAPGTYTVEFSTSAPAAGVSGEARVTVFTGTVPEGFTAWDDAAEGG